MIRVFLAKDVAISNLLQVLDPGEGAKVVYRGYPNDDYVVVLDKPTNWDDDNGCDNTGITPISDEQQEQSLICFMTTGLHIGQRVTVKGWVGEGVIETMAPQDDWESPGMHYGVRLDDGHMIWVPVGRSNEYISRVIGNHPQKV